MITFKRTSLEDFVKSYSPKTPSKDDINAFEGHIQAFFSKALGSSGEEYQKNEINSFLKNVFDYDCNTKDRIDSAIYADGIAQVLIEVKALGKSGFPKSPDNPISTALSESILYFLREFRASNNSIKHIILCTPCEFFIFDAKSFLIFERDKHIKELHNNCDAKKGTDTTTKKFYSDLENHLNGDFEGTLPFTYFNLQEAIKDKNRKNLSFIYQLLSPQVLLKQQKTIDANTLNKKFYDELLYILGLEEKSESGKTTIVRSGVKNTLADAIKKEYESLSEEEIFALLITWNNRVLFLCLLESMLVGFKHISSRFLNSVVVENFRALSTLFFEVLAKKQSERDSELEPAIFKQIPYLNSSLFDKTPLEREGNEIWRLDSRELALYPTSILKTKDKSQTTLPLLEYYLAFLQAYDFTTTPKDIQDNIKTNHDTLINSAVLGLVFEKLNGYKEGSFYTPSFITSYMCEDAINRAIITRFNAEYGWQCKNLEELENTFKSYIGDQDKLEKFRKTFLSIRICDPAVGSGHFLVSALNYLIYMAYRLRIFGIGAEIALQNDELLIYHEGDIFQYTKPKLSDSHSQGIQQSLFNLKKSIIENCLFGVDINPNSCEITKLRLWIELLKHSYYKIEDNQITNELQTLPNIDINIKCGNSLLSNHPINSPFTTSPTLDFTKKLENRIHQYKSAVQRYKDSLSSKSEIIKELDEIKATLRGHLSENSQTSQSLRKNLKIFFNDYGDEVFDIKTDFGKDMLYIIRDKKFSKQLRTEPAPMDKKGEKLLAQIKKDYEILESMKHNNAFEWRFEFPEVLDSDGNFTGFDCVIGNPPYISNKGTKGKDELKKAFGFSDDLYVHFFFVAQKLAKQGGIIAYITPNTFWTIDSKRNLRELLFSNQILAMVNSKNPFSEAMVNTSITIFSTQMPQKEMRFVDTLKSFDEQEIYSIDQKVFQEAGVFFIPTPYNLAIKDKFAHALKPLYEKWWSFIDTSDKIAKNKASLETYRQSLKSGDITLMGLLTDGGQGLATANNGKFVGVREGSKEAQRTKEARAEKLYQAESKLNLGLKSKKDALEFLASKTEQEIWKLFDDAKEKFGRDIFGQGFLFRIISDSQIADVKSLSQDEKANGINSPKCFVPYDKGDKDGNRWYLPTPYYIAWSRENVKFLKENSGKKGQGMPVVRNSQFYFREGFCWSDINSTYLKCRLKGKSVNDVSSMSMYAEALSEKYFVCIINSRFMSKYVDTFINNTSHFQINDARQVPIIIPTQKQLESFEKLFDRAYASQVEKFQDGVDNEAYLLEIQKELDAMVYELYGLGSEEIELIERG